MNYLSRCYGHVPFEWLTEELYKTYRRNKSGCAQTDSDLSVSIEFGKQGDTEGSDKGLFLN